MSVIAKFSFFLKGHIMARSKFNPLAFIRAYAQAVKADDVENRGTVDDVARALGAPAGTVHNWIKKYGGSDDKEADMRYPKITALIQARELRAGKRGASTPKVSDDELVAACADLDIDIDELIGT